MISICVTVKNRSRVQIDGRELRLFPNCVESIVQATEGRSDCELVVADWGSDDWPLEDWLLERAKPVPVRLIEVRGNFSRGQGRNRAAAAARGQSLLFVDADVLLCGGVLTAGIECSRMGKAYFPVLYSFDTPEHTSGWWRHFGYGNCLLGRSLFDRVGGWPEYQGWGREDDDFHKRVAAVAEVVREETPGFYHQWHPDDVEWKDRLVKKPPFVEQEYRQRELARDELTGIIPPGEVVVLVDEARFGSDPIRGMRVLPFLEKNGEYWGVPPDDTTAVAELNRLHVHGARYVAFAWMAFWWLDHFAALRRHLFEGSSCIFQSERLIVFDLNSGARAGGAV